MEAGKVVAAALTMAALTAHAGEGVVGQPSVHFVRSATYGDHLVAVGLLFPQNLAFSVLPTASLCTCRTTCWSHTKCKSAAFMPRSEGNLCHLSTERHDNRTLVADQQATYVFWADTVPGMYFGPMDDGLMYLEMNTTRVYNSARLQCEFLPGHRLGIYNTATNNKMLKDIYRRQPGTRVWVDLHKQRQSGNTVREWADGSQFDSFGDVLSEDDPTQIWYSWGENVNGAGEFVDELQTEKLRVVCQVDVFGVVGW